MWIPQVGGQNPPVLVQWQYPLTKTATKLKVTMGLRQAINDKCKDCNYDPLDKGTWRQQVESCTFKGCPLWEYRPKTIKKQNKKINP